MSRKILILTYWSFKDPLIQTYTLPYVRIIQKNSSGGTCFLVTLEKDEYKISNSQQAEIKKRLLLEGIYWKPFRYHPFGFRALLTWSFILLQLSVFVIRKRIDAVHAWCTPAGAAGYILSVLTGRKLILDSYEPHAEAMVENGTWKKESLPFKLLFWFEKRQTRKAHAIIGTTLGMRQYAKEKYDTEIKKFFVKPACVDLELFSSNEIKDQELLKGFGFTDKIVCVYAGKLGGIYLDQELFDFFKAAVDFWGDAFRVLLLSNLEPSKVEAYCSRAGISPAFVKLAFVEHASVPRYLGLGDFAITPVRPVPSKQFCTPIKDGEYWALGLPVVIPVHISDDSEIIEVNDIGAVMNKLDQAAYQEAIVKIDRLMKQPKEVNYARIRAIAQKYRSFEIAVEVYRQVYPA